MRLDFSPVEKMESSASTLYLKTMLSGVKNVLPGTSEHDNSVIFNVSDFVAQWNNSVSALEDYLAQQVFGGPVTREDVQRHALGAFGPAMKSLGSADQVAAWGVLHSVITDGEDARRYVVPLGVCTRTRDEGISQLVTVRHDQTGENQHTDDPKWPIVDLSDGYSGYYLVPYPSQSAWGRGNQHTFVRWELLACNSIYNVYRWYVSLTHMPLGWKASILVLGIIHMKDKKIISLFPHWRSYQHHWIIPGSTGNDDHAYNPDYVPPVSKPSFRKRLAL